METLRLNLEVLTISFFCPNCGTKIEFNGEEMTGDDCGNVYADVKCEKCSQLFQLVSELEKV